MRIKVGCYYHITMLLFMHPTVDVSTGVYLGSLPFTKVICPPFMYTLSDH